MGLTVLCHTKFLFNILLADLLAGKDDNQVKKAYALFRKSILPFPKKHTSFSEKARILSGKRADAFQPGTTSSRVRESETIFFVK